MKENLGQDAVRHIADILSVSMDRFDKGSFIKDALAGLDELELKQRVNHLIKVLALYLPDEFEKTFEVLKAVKGNWHKPEGGDNWFSFAAWPLIDYVAEYGTNDPEIALDVLKTLTPLFSAEFAIRTFIDQHFDLTYKQLLLWAEDEDEHVRRLASEGMRPRLPWGKQLTQFCDDPTAIFPILERLKDDVSLYVRKSVANNLNDISKDHPKQVVALCQCWYDNASADRLWIIRHALRTLIKSGHPEVFSLLGYTAEPQVNLQKIDLDKAVIELGDNVAITVNLFSKSSQIQKMVVDYKIHHVKANGKTTAKVFKWKNITLRSNEELQMVKRHSFKPISTRKYYSGTHQIELLINGQPYGKKEFELIVE
ncbi:hypothetical protein A9Q79_03020 [Methylophaga sp. 42_25_T18]|nr:hypothetical protein A9Q79_03020 [Methylophaga sp. 42_25_T18]OUR87688.1 hypothetical protein A9Q92_04050 [Methylophaga sp. 42_8_T64]